MYDHVAGGVDRWRWPLCVDSPTMTHDLTTELGSVRASELTGKAPVLSELQDSNSLHT